MYKTETEDATIAKNPLSPVIKSSSESHLRWYDPQCVHFVAPGLIRVLQETHSGSAGILGLLSSPLGLTKHLSYSPHCSLADVSKHTQSPNPTAPWGQNDSLHFERPHRPRVRRIPTCLTADMDRTLILLAYAGVEFFIRPEISIGIYITHSRTPIVGEYFAGR